MTTDAAPLATTLRPPATDLRRSTVDRHFFEATASALQTLGFDVGTACARHGLPDPLAGDEERIPLALVSPVYDLAERELGDPAFVYRLGEYTQAGRTDLLFRLLACCATPLEMMRMTCRYSSIATDVVRYQLSDHGSHAVMRILPNPEVYVTLHQLELATWLYARWRELLRGITGVAADCEVAFGHAPRFAPARYAEFYPGVPLSFGHGTTHVILRGEALYRPIPGHDAHQRDWYRSQAERYETRTLAGASDIVAQVAQLFMQRMAFGEPEAGDIATLLGMSRRTLQRRLLEAGSSWREATDLARHQVALGELANCERPLHEIALLTGYADTRAFLRAFRRWTGLTPSQYRQQATR